MRLATLTKTQQSSPFAQAEQKQLRRLSAVVVLSTPLFAMTADYNDAHQRPSSSNVPAPVLADCPRDPRDLSAVKAAARDSSVGTRLSGYTAIFVFFSCPSPPTSPCTAFTTPGQIRYYRGRFSIVASNRSCVFKSKYFACT